MCHYLKVNKALPSLAGLFVSGNTEKQGRGAPLLAGSTGKKALGVYLGGTEANCGTGPSYFVYLTSNYTNLLSYLRDGSETNTATVRMNYCKPSENLFGVLNFSNSYLVTGSIVSTQSINDGISVAYRAGSFIELNNGFYSGTDFVAEINPCVISRTTIAAKTEDVFEEQSLYFNQQGESIFIKIYPTVVASGNLINVEINETIQNVSITIYDIQGKSVQFVNLQEINANEKFSLPIGYLTSGFYFVRFQSNPISFTQKIIVR